MTVAMIYSTQLEKNFFAALERRADMQSAVLQMFKDFKSGALDL
jgi:hypothetical protein